MKADITSGAAPPPDVVSNLISEALQSDGSLSYDDLVKTLGPPRRVETEPIVNQYVPDQTDTLRTLVYRGVEALVYDVSGKPRTFLIRFSLLSERYATPEGVRVGHRRQNVFDRIGPPTHRKPGKGELVYQETEPTPTSMIIRIEGGQVVRIDWEFYVS